MHLSQCQFLVLAWMFAACGGGGGGPATQAGSSAKGASSPTAGTHAGAAGTSATTAGMHASTPGTDKTTSGSGAAGGKNASASGAGAVAGMMSINEDDAGPGDMPLNGAGSCCSEHTTPGCGNADLQVCVCEKVPECCTKAWTAACVFIVTNRYCQAGVRDCVCGTGTDQWGQTQCCDTEWGASCDSVAQRKCGAAPGCF